MAPPRASAGAKPQEEGHYNPAGAYLQWRGFVEAKPWLQSNFINY
jgi:hypothetical protein